MDKVGKRNLKCKMNEPSTTKENGHDQGMGKPNLDPVHETIACSLQNSEVVVICRICNDFVDNLRH